ALRQFKSATNEMTAQRVMKMSLLLPTPEIPLANLEPFTRVLKRAVATAEPLKEGTYSPASWDLTLLGLLDYRCGSCSGALNLVWRGLVTCTYTSMPTAQDRAILAMCRYKLGEKAAARIDLEIATNFVQRGMDAGVDSWNWPDWVFARLLLQEAGSLVPQSPLPPK
ncbi:MAG: hypothetical protein ACREIC_21545, partial [Limisphaerales bacterium]